MISSYVSKSLITVILSKADPILQELTMKEESHIQYSLSLLLRNKKNEMFQWST